MGSLGIRGREPVSSPGDVKRRNRELCDDVIRIVREHAAGDLHKPLFLYYALHEPHTPQIPESVFVGKSEAREYGDYIVQLDHWVGQVVDVLEETGLEENTLVVFASDNGASKRNMAICPTHTANGVLSGHKASPLEGGHRVPLIVKWPARIPPSTVSAALVNHTDFFATLAELLDVDLSATYPGTAEDSYSFLPVLMDPSARHSRPPMVVVKSFRNRNWKLIVNDHTAAVEDVDMVELYNLEDDLSEKANLIETNPGKAQALFEQFKEFLAHRDIKAGAVKSRGRTQDTMSRETGKEKTRARKAGKMKLAFAVLLVVSMSCFANADQPPNIVLFIADDVSAEDIGCYGHPSIKTPNIDKLAAQGMRFENAYLTTSSCSPSRCSIISGRYPHNHGAPELHIPLPANQPKFPEMLRAAGYYTLLSGKHHMGDEANVAFTEVSEGAGLGKEEDWVQCVQKRPRDKPFFMWFASTDAHSPHKINADAPKYEPSDVVVPPYMYDSPGIRKRLAAYYHEVSRFDTYVGRVVAELETQEVLDNTVIIVMADNGRPFPRAKTRLYDSGIKTPLLVCYPKTNQAGPGFQKPGQFNRHCADGARIGGTR